MMKYRYIDKIVKNNILNKKVEIDVSWESLETKLDSTKVVNATVSKSFFASTFFKIFSALFISSTILLSFIYINNSKKNTNIISAKNTSVKISNIRKVSRENYTNKNIVSPVKKISPKDKVVQQKHSTTIIKVEKTDIDTVRIK